MIDLKRISFISSEVQLIKSMYCNKETLIYNEVEYFIEKIIIKDTTQPQITVYLLEVDKPTNSPPMH